MPFIDMLSLENNLLKKSNFMTDHLNDALYPQIGPLRLAMSCLRSLYLLIGLLWFEMSCILFPLSSNWSSTV